MSKTADGTISCKDGTKFIATFVIINQDMQFTFLGNLSSPVPAFSSANATLKYDRVNQLVAARQFNGQLGEKNVELMTANGPVIMGVLGLSVSEDIRVFGSGVWVIS